MYFRLSLASAETTYDKLTNVSDRCHRSHVSALSHEWLATLREYNKTNNRGSAVIGSSCCGVPAQIFKLLLVYCYVLINSVVLCILLGKANKIKNK